MTMYSSLEYGWPLATTEFANARLRALELTEDPIALRNLLAAVNAGRFQKGAMDEEDSRLNLDIAAAVLEAHIEELTEEKPVETGQNSFAGRVSRIMGESSHLSSEQYEALERDRLEFIVAVLFYVVGDNAVSAPADHSPTSQENSDTLGAPPRMDGLIAGRKTKAYREDLQLIRQAALVATGPMFLAGP